MGNKDIQSYRMDPQNRGATEKLRPFSVKKKKVAEGEYGRSL